MKFQKCAWIKFYWYIVQDIGMYNVHVLKRILRDRFNVISVIKSSLERMDDRKQFNDRLYNKYSLYKNRMSKRWR